MLSHRQRTHREKQNSRNNCFRRNGWQESSQTSVSTQEATERPKKQSRRKADRDSALQSAWQVVPPPQMGVYHSQQWPRHQRPLPSVYTFNTEINPTIMPLHRPLGRSSDKNIIFRWKITTAGRQQSKIELQWQYHSRWTFILGMINATLKLPMLQMSFVAHRL